MQAEVFTHPVKEYNGIVDRIPHDGKCCCDELLVNIKREWKPSVKYGKDRKQYEYVMEQCYQGAHSELPASEPGQHEQKQTNQRKQDRINDTAFDFTCNRRANLLFALGYVLRPQSGEAWLQIRTGNFFR